MNSEWSPAIIELLTISVHLFSVLIYLGVARLSDKRQIRGAYCMLFNWIVIFGYVMLFPHLNPGLSYTAYFLVAWGCYLSVVMPMSWLAANNPRCLKRTIATGIQLTLGNASGVAAPFLYVSTTGQHHAGYGADAGMLVVSSPGYPFTHGYWRRRKNAKRAGEVDHLVAGLTPEEKDDAGDRNPNYLFTL